MELVSTASKSTLIPEAADLVKFNTSLSDEPFEVNKAFCQDPDSRKVNLSIGVYRSDQCTPWPLPVVRKAEELIHKKADPSRHEYTAIIGDEEFLAVARDLTFGFDEKTDLQDTLRVISIQTISGTGANHLGAMFIARGFRPNAVWLPDPTWSNHYSIWDLTGVECRAYPYYDNVAQLLDFDKMIGVLMTQAQRGDAIVLHACAHNPTGTDPTKDQWKEIAEICKHLDLLVLFDSAYQGFATGDVDDDAWPIRYFFGQNPPIKLCVAQSFSKNFGLYGQRVGACHVALGSGSVEGNASVRSQFAYFIRAEYSMAPRWGCEIVKRILQDPELRQQWREDLISMSDRIKLMRKALYIKLLELRTPGSWDHLLSQVGMFSYTGLSPAQVSLLRRKHHIYMLQSGRISLSGLQSGNISYVASSVDDVVRNA